MSSSQAENYKVFCIISGGNALFSVEIAKNKSVAELKNKIKGKKNSLLANIDADELNLYQVDVRDDDNLEKSVQQKMAGNPRPLRSTTKMVDLYSETLQEYFIQMVVRVSTSSG
jgi:hypothetical protein